MKKLLIIPLFFLSLIVSATNYYVKTGGNDANTGLSDAQAWLTVTKVNTVWAAGTFAAGDSILFNRGNTFTGTITITESGEDGNTIIIGAYGTGLKPVITGFTTLSSWTDEGSSVYSKAFTSVAQTNMVLVNGVQVAMGRIPNGEWSTYEARTSTTITDNQLSASPDWDNAEVVIRKNAYETDRNTITNHTGTSITFTTLGSSQLPTVGYGYFIQNDLRTLDATNEWYHSTSAGKLYIYGNPAAKTVKVATINNLVYDNGYDYITIENITFEGSIQDGLYFASDANYITVQNCVVKFCGKQGIYVSGTNLTADADSITDVNWAGIWAYRASNTANNSVITNCYIKRCGSVVGQATYGVYGRGISVAGSSSLVQYNEIDSVNYVGIWFKGNSTAIRNNFIKHYCLYTTDGSAIYTTGEPVSTGQIVNGNIILDGTYVVTGGGTTNVTPGIYLDDYSANITVTNNIVINAPYAGIKVHLGVDNTITDNLLYNSSKGLNFQNEGTTHYEGNSVRRNKIIAKGSTDYALRYFSDDGLYFGTADSNYYARPIDDDYVINSDYLNNEDPKTLAEWKTASGQDANSLGSPVVISDTTTSIDVYYNASLTPDTILVTDMIDITGTKYADTLILAAYTGAVLLADPDPDVDPPSPPVVTTSVTNYYALGATIAGNCTSVGGGTVSEKGIVYATHTAPLTSDTKIICGTGLGAFSTSITLSRGTTYYFRSYATNGILQYGNEESFTTPLFSRIKDSGKYLKNGGKYLIIR